MPATTKASSGASSAGISTLPTSPSAITAWKPAAATAEPTTPPISACEELEGSPKYQVARFQAIAPISPAKTIVGVITSALTTSVATVAATEIEMKAPTKLRIEAKAIATCGRAALVEIEVATTLAVSWKPLVKSKARAVPTTITRMMSELTRETYPPRLHLCYNPRPGLLTKPGGCQARTQGASRGERTPVRDPKASDRGHRLATSGQVRSF